MALVDCDMTSPPGPVRLVTTTTHELWFAFHPDKQHIIREAVHTKSVCPRLKIIVGAGDQHCVRILGSILGSLLPRALQPASHNMKVELLSHPALTCNRPTSNVTVKADAQLAHITFRASMVTAGHLTSTLTKPDTSLTRVCVTSNQ